MLLASRIIGTSEGQLSKYRLRASDLRLWCLKVAEAHAEAGECSRSMASAAMTEHSAAMTEHSAAMTEHKSDTRRERRRQLSVLNTIVGAADVVGNLPVAHRAKE